MNALCGLLLLWVVGAEPSVNPTNAAWERSDGERVQVQRKAVAANTAASKAAQDQVGPDTDRDGIPDGRDRCRNEPEDRDGFQDTDGCPDPDNDGDTVVDVRDRCPNQAGDPNHGGCPEIDSDGDGIPDDLDECPDIAEDKDGNRDGDGCPEPETNDLDGDGIPNWLDACPDKPEDKDSFQDADGCPDPDNDMDGILDGADTCPLQPGPPPTGCPVRDRDNDGLNDDVDQCPDVAGLPPSGCPKKVMVIKTANKIEITQQINFANGRATIKKADASFEIINQVASVLLANPQMRVIIEGHTDNAGRANRNLQLSDDRANAVRAALIDRGVEAGRLQAIGYGQTKPIAPNRNALGRAKNRRVEFTIVQAESASAPARKP